MKKWIAITGFILVSAIGTASVVEAAIRCRYEVIEYECSCGGPPCEMWQLACQSY